MKTLKIFLRDLKVNLRKFLSLNQTAGTGVLMDCGIVVAMAVAVYLVLLPRFKRALK